MEGCGEGLPQECQVILPRLRRNRGDPEAAPNPFGLQPDPLANPVTDFTSGHVAQSTEFPHYRLLSGWNRTDSSAHRCDSALVLPARPANRDAATLARSWRPDRRCLR